MKIRARHCFPLLAILIFLVAGCGSKTAKTAMQAAPAGDGTKITSAELIDLLSGNTITMHEYGNTATIEMYDNGKMHAIKSKTEKNDGLWSTENDRLCLKFRRWGFGDTTCYTVFRKGEEYNLYTDTGLKTSYFTVSKGVKRAPAASGQKKTGGKRTATSSPDVVVEGQPAPVPSAPAIQETTSYNLQTATRDLGMIYRDMSKNCPGCNLQGANLAEASLIRAKLAGANLTNANLGKANLKWADLKGANLTRADLSGANLAGADLAGANLERADLTGANLEQANLRGATIEGAIGLDLKKAIR